MKKKWQIVVGEWPLEEVGLVDNFFLLGREISHSFCALVDEAGDIVEELHGRSYNSKCLMGSKVTSIGFSQLFNAFSTPTHKPVKTSHKARLRVFREDPKTPDFHKKKRTVFTMIEGGSQLDIEKKWHSMMVEADRINDADLDYIPIGTMGRPGQNCHTVMSCLISVSGVAHNKIKSLLPKNLVRPGLRRKISDGLQGRFMNACMKPTAWLRKNLTFDVVHHKFRASFWSLSKTTNPHQSSGQSSGQPSRPLSTQRSASL